MNKLIKFSAIIVFVLISCLLCACSNSNNKILSFAKNRGAINPQITETYELTDEEIKKTFNGVDDEYDYETQTYKEGYPECIRYTIKSDNYPEYHIYSIKCHANTINSTTNHDTSYEFNIHQGIPVLEEKTDINIDSKEVTLNINNFTDDLLQVMFEQKFLPEHKTDKLISKDSSDYEYDNYYIYMFRKTDDYEDAREFVQEFQYFIEDNNISRIELPGYVGLQDYTYFEIRVIPSKGDPLFSADLSVHEYSFDYERNLVNELDDQIKNNYIITDNVYYIKKESNNE